MSVRIKLLPAESEYFTNFDTIQGTVELNTNSSESVTAVVVKVEGLAKTLCYTEPGNGKTRSRTPVHETHKVLYLTDAVFPDEALRKSSTAASFTLPPGKHSWPFKFQIPVNNDCKSESRSKSSLGALISGSSAVLNQRHVQQILPPSMSGSEECWVRYFVKVTVVRPSMLALNHREWVPFIFLPIEAPRAEEATQNEAFFIKRQHTLSLVDDKKGKGIMSFLSDPRRKEGDTIAIEVRMSNPPSVTPGLPVNMDIMGFFESNVNNNVLAISKVVVYLIANTKIKAGGLRRQLGSRILTYSNDFNIPFNIPERSVDPAAILRIMSGHPLIIATDTPPTFATCNMSRSYEFEIAVTVTHGKAKVKETVVLTCPILVLSGVRAPPPQMQPPVGSSNNTDSTTHRRASSTGGSNRPPVVSSAGEASVGVSGGEAIDDLPTYVEAVQVGATPARVVIPLQTARAAIRTRTSYRVGQDYYKYPGPEK